MGRSPLCSWDRVGIALMLAAFGCGHDGDERAASGGAPRSGGEGGGAFDTGGGPAGAGTGGATVPGDLCAGLVQDRDAHPMTSLPKPDVGEAVTDYEFGTVIRRVTAVDAGTSGNDPVIKPMYSTVSAFNADESLLLLYDVAAGQHELYDGRSYECLGALDLQPPDLEQVYWHTSDPDVLLLVEDRDFVRYHVGEARKERVTTFDFCTDSVTAGSDPMFTSFDSARIGLGCGDQQFLYDIEANEVLARITSDGNPAQVAPSGELAYLSDSGEVTDTGLNVLRTLDLVEPWGHASMGLLPNGDDTWNGAVFDPGPGGNEDIGTLVTWNLAEGTSRVIIGPDTGYPYPPSGHLSALAYRQPGWVVVSTYGDTAGSGLLDLELLIADTVSGTVCRVGRHRSWGKENTQLVEPYWAEAHAVPSPSGTRIVFGSDWGNGATVDTYVLELPSYAP